MRRGAPNRIRSTSACNSISRGRPPSRVTVTMLPAAGSGALDRKIAEGLRDLLQPALGHGEKSELVDRSEAIFRGANDPVTAARLTLEVENGVDEVLQHAAGPRSCPPS